MESSSLRVKKETVSQLKELKDKNGFASIDSVIRMLLKKLNQHPYLNITK